VVWGVTACALAGATLAAGALAAGALAGCAQTGRQPAPDAGPDAATTWCGDGVVDTAAGETCDDGNLLDGDGCGPQCQVEQGWQCSGEPSLCESLCGNQVLDEQEGEQCEGDDLAGQSCATVPGGYTSGTLACTAGCRFDTTGCVLPGCGNGVVDGGEACDDGNGDNDDACLNNCKANTCGDGYLYTGDEECDDGNTSNADACLDTCQQARCGDGYLYAGHEECDDGNTASGDGCSTACDIEYCGDGVVQANLGEQCEGGTQICTTSCGTTGEQTCQANCAWSSCVPPAETCNAEDDDCDGEIDDPSCFDVVYRFYNATTGDHMWKVNSTSADPGYTPETFRYFHVYASQVPGTYPVYQRYKAASGDHLLTGDPTEGDAVGYTGAEIIGYMAPDPAWPAAGMTSSAGCRYYNSQSGDHLHHIEFAPGDVPANYTLEYCGLHWWGFH
jgi:cysteine-rich repeat protein